MEWNSKLPSHVVMFLLISLLMGFCMSAPVKHGTGYPCLLSSACNNDAESVYAYYKNDSYCCRAGDAIILSVSGGGIQYTQTYYSYVNTGNDTEGNDENGEGGIVKRSADNDDFGQNSTLPITFTYNCICKQVDASGLGVNVYGMSMASLTDALDGALNDVNDVVNDILGGEEDLLDNILP